MVEGIRLCESACETKTQIDSLFVTEEALAKWDQILQKVSSKAHKTYIVTPELIKKISDTQTPQGAVCVCHMPKDSLSLAKIVSMRRVFLLENIQDPANLGALLRSAAAFSIEALVLSPGCCDLFSPKTLRGSMGAIFSVPIYRSQNFVDSILFLNGGGVQTLAAVPTGENFIHPIEATTDSSLNSAACDTENQNFFVQKIDFSRNTAVALGNEGNGLSRAARDACTAEVTIPTGPDVESLNAAVAGSILMWEMARGGS